MRSRPRKPFVLFLVILILLLVAIVFYREGTLPVNKQSTSHKIFVIKPGEGLLTITKELKSEGFIRNRLVFFIVVKQLGIEKNIQAGDYRLSENMSAYQIAKSLTHGTLDVWVTIIEGLRKEEIAEILNDAFKIPEVEFVNKADEGYLFPDTYLLSKDSSAEGIISALRKNFDKKYDSAVQAKANRLGLSQRQVITLASLVEREAKSEADRRTVASIMLRRINEGMRLNIDATVQYALGYQSEEKTWWKKNLSLDDLKVASPYNTYVNYGLPPGPICNPGLSSILAVVNANPNTPYLYYLNDRRGKMHFSKTLEEQESNQERYLK